MWKRNWVPRRGCETLLNVIALLIDGPALTLCLPIENMKRNFEEMDKKHMNHMHK